MQPVNDDMDHLFRQAANDYPLNTQGADFDKLQQRMQAPEAEVSLKKERRRPYSWLLLLLLALPFVCRHYYSSTTGGNTSLVTQQNSEKTEQQPTSISNQNNTTATPDKNSTDNKLSSSNPNTTVTINSTLEPTNMPNAATPGNSIITQQPNSNTGGSFSQKKRNRKDIRINAATSDNTEQTPGSKTRQRKNVNAKWSSSKSGVETGVIEVGIVAKQTGIKNRLSGENESIAHSALPAAKQNNQPDDMVQKDTIELTRKTIDTAASAMAKKAAAKDSTALDSTSLVKKQLGKDKKPKTYFYAGLIAGPDYSVVKSFQTAGTGYNAGIIAGYQFGKHLAVETGLLWAYKKYRSEGDYVSTENLGLATHTQVMHADGSCGMFEIPLNLQYHFSSRQNGHWYISAGLSSYLMKKEEYYYMGKRYNMEYYAEKEYFNSTKNWFSVLQFSGGYQWQLGKRASLRAEPYIKLPVSKIGIARLPLNSAGLNIGYTMPL